jgi:hypothetical protein
MARYGMEVIDQFALHIVKRFRMEHREIAERCRQPFDRMRFRRE